MSRCFPFPPPGYENKEKSETNEKSSLEDLLVKEKHKEKKHKKEKRDREKREDKEKKEKDRSKDKHKEKKDRKDRKEKHKEKKKDKDKTKVLSNSIERQNDSHHEGSLGESSQKIEETNNSKFTLELAKRVKDEEKEKASRMVADYNGSVRRSTNGLDSSVARVMERAAGSQSMSPSLSVSQRTHEMGRISNNITSSTRKVESPGSTHLLWKERSSSQSEQKLNIDVQRGTTGSALPMGKSVGSVQRRSDGPYSSTAGEDGELIIQKPINGMRRSPEGVSSLSNKAFNAISFSTKAEDRDVSKTSTNSILLGQRNVEGMARPVEDASEKSIEGKEKKKDKKSKQDKHRDKNRDEKSKKKKEKDKLKEKEKTKILEEVAPKHKNYDEPRDIIKKDHIESLKVKPLTLQSVDVCHSNDKNIRKRKEIETNGVFHESILQPKKIPRAIPSPCILAENGSILELPQISSASFSMKSGAMNNIIPEPGDVSRCIPNGATEAGLRHTVAQDFDLASKVSLRPPHSDAKYLSSIYTVPKLDQWPEHDDQEWLSSNSKQRQKPESQVRADLKPQVWAEAVKIDSEDVLAFPYVVPF